MDKIGFGGGCHWCTEGVFQALKGVVSVDQGFIQSDAPWDIWAEGVIVHFDPMIVSLATLCRVHLETHSANTTYSPGGRYRSAVYLFEAEQCDHAVQAIAQHMQGSGETSRTMVLPFARFKPSEARYQNYYRTAPGRPFCRRYIEPKLDHIRHRFRDIAQPD